MAELENNRIIRTSEGEEIKVLEEIGRGGQGIVYKVSFREKDYALKWYWEGVDNDGEKFYENLEKNVEAGSPAKTFLWPMALTEKDSDGCFGYVMDLRPKNYVKFGEILLAHEKYSGFEAIVNSALQFSASFKQLHNAGFSYQDLNEGNFFVNPETGDVLICDNDNVSPNGENCGISGKTGYMAPEILNRDMDNRPDKYSDRFSLAVVLFYLLFRDHPLRGQAEDFDDPDGDYEIMCRNPVFIFDETDSSNRPREQVCVNAPRLWNIYPPFVKEIFRKAFSKSTMKCNGDGKEDRVLELDWCKTFSWLRNSIVRCPKCSGETFFPMKSETARCMQCNEEIERPSAIQIKDKIIPLQVGSRIYLYDIDPMADFTIETINTVVGEVVENKNQKGLFGIKNLSKDTWFRHSPGGIERTCPPNDGVLIAKDNTVKFGTKSEGRIL